MKRKLLAGLLCGMMLLQAGCGSSGVPQEMYEQAVAERDEYKEKYEQLKEEQEEQKQQEKQTETALETETDAAQDDDDKKDTYDESYEMLDGKEDGQQSSLEDAQSGAKEIKEANAEIDVEAVEEYYYIDSIGSARYFLIVKNNSLETAEVNVNATAKDSDGNLIGAATSSEYAIPGGYEVCIDCYFDDAKEAASFEYTLDAKKDTYYDAVIQDLSYEESRTDKKVILSCTNNGDDPAQFVKATALFFSGGSLVCADSTYVTDDDSEIKSGATIVKELTCYETGSYDDLKIYLSGRK